MNYETFAQYWRDAPEGSEIEYMKGFLSYDKPLTEDFKLYQAALAKQDSAALRMQIKLATFKLRGNKHER